MAAETSQVPMAANREATGSLLRRAQYSRVWMRLVAIAGWSMIFLIYVPVIWLIAMSVSGRPLSGRVAPFTLRWYETLFTDVRWVEPLQSSTALGLIVALACMLIATAVGRVIPRLQRPGRVVFFAVLPLFVPGLTMGVALFLLLRSFLGLSLGFWSLFIGHLVWALPFSLLLVLVFCTRFDYRLLEAAEDLGASAWQRFWHIEFPIMRPAIVGSALFGFLLSFNELLRSIFLRGAATTLPVFQWADVSSHQSQVPVTFALASLIFAATLPAMSALFWFLFVKLRS